MSACHGGLSHGRSEAGRRPAGPAGQPQDRIRTSVKATSTAAATAAQTSSFGRPRGAGAEPNVLPPVGQDVASDSSVAPHSPQRMSTRCQGPTTLPPVPIDDVVVADGHLSNQLRM